MEKALGKNFDTCLAKDRVAFHEMIDWSSHIVCLWSELKVSVSPLWHLRTHAAHGQIRAAVHKVPRLIV